MKKLISALDIDNENKALELVEKLSPWVDLFKVGPVLFLKTGPRIISEIKNMGKEVFLDLKFHDIPQTVKRAVKSAADLGIYSLTLHSSGGQEMINAAAEVPNRPKLWAVTVLTSQASTTEQVTERACFAQKSGADGVITSPLEVEFIKEFCGKSFIVVTPGIRLTKTDDDQKRVNTPSSAIKAGADFIVVGRPIIQADDPSEAAKAISEDMDGVKHGI